MEYILEKKSFYRKVFSSTPHFWDIMSHTSL